MNKFSELLVECHNLADALTNIYKIADDQLLAANKTYDVIHRGKTFKFHPPVNKKEFLQLSKDRQALLHAWIVDAFKEVFSNGIHKMETESDREELVLKSFSLLLHLTLGANPKDYVFDRDAYMASDDRPRNPDGTLAKKAVALDLESPYVQNDLKGEHVQPNQASSESV